MEKVDTCRRSHACGQARTCIYAQMHAPRMHAHTHAHACMNMRVCARTHTRTHAHTHTHTHKCMYVHAHTHTHTHACMHVHRQNTHIHKRIRIEFETKVRCIPPYISMPQKGLWTYYEFNVWFLPPLSRLSFHPVSSQDIPKGYEQILMKHLVMIGQVSRTKQWDNAEDAYVFLGAESCWRSLYSVGLHVCVFWQYSSHSLSGHRQRTGGNAEIAGCPEKWGSLQHGKANSNRTLQNMLWLCMKMFNKCM